MNVDHYPFDFDTLEKGQLIPADALERILGITRGSPKYALKVLAVREQVIRELKNRGKIWTVKVEGFDLKILTDEEAVGYNHAQFQQGHSRAARSHVRTKFIDRTALSDAQKTTYDRNLLIQATVQQAVRSARRIATQPHVRATPGLLAPPEEAQSA